MLFRFKILFLLFSLIASFAFSQNGQSSDEQMAQQYFASKEYDKAVVYYEKMYEKRPNDFIYTNYLKCLTELKEFKKAEKLIKKQLKQFPFRNDYLVDLGALYRASGDEKKGTQQYEEAINELPQDRTQVFQLANAFIDIQLWDYALKTYLKGRKYFGQEYSFNIEIAQVYYAKGDIVAMANEYLDVLERGENYLQQVQSGLQINYGPSADENRNAIIKGELLKRVQKSSDKTIFSELLIWMQLQEKDFEGAFLQVKALDKRKKEEGVRMMSLAQIASSNEQYDVAEKACQYVIQLGKQNYYYRDAQIKLLDVAYQKVLSKNNFQIAEIVQLEKKFFSTLDELGKSYSTISLMKQLAHLQAFYLNKPQDAKNVLGEAIALPQANELAVAECKLDMADILLMEGNIWDASLMYSQVEKSFKHEPIGQEAKFRNAKLCYYNGEFAWAKAQLDVLKAATSKLIANDALDLSLLITDNTTIDTNTTPLLMYAHADLFAFQNKTERALELLDSINILFPNHELEDDVLWKKSQIMLKNQRFEETAKNLEKIISTFSEGILGDDAMFKLAELNEEKFNNVEKAKELYQEVLVKYPSSIYSVEARKRFRKLRGDNLN